MMNFNMSLISFLCILLTYTSSQPLYKLPSDLVEQLHLDVRARIDTFERTDDTDNFPLLPTSVRLSFHDCGGDDLCDGCINLLDAEHGGLEFGAVYPIEQVYQNNQILTLSDPANGQNFQYTTNDGWTTNPSGLQWSNLMWNGQSYLISRSDFWILFATSALEYGVEIAYLYDDLPAPTVHAQEWEDACIDINENGVLLGTGGEIDCVDVLYLYGRSSCTTSPFISYDGFHTNTHWSYNELIRFFYNKWGMSELNVVALFGLHTLGKGHPVIDRNILKSQQSCCGGSGFRGEWDISTEMAGLDHEYYRWLRRRANLRKPSNFVRFVGDTEYALFGDDIQWVTLANEFGDTRALTNFFLDIDVQMFMIFSNTSINCNHPVMDDKFKQYPDREGDEFISRDEDYGQPCVRRQISGLLNGNVWDVFDLDNVAWLYYLQEPWELMTQNHYNYRGTHHVGIKLVVAQPPSGSNSNWFGVYVYNVGCGETIQTLRFIDTSGLLVASYDSVEGYYYYDQVSLAFPLGIRISIVSVEPTSIRQVQLITTDTPGEEYYMGTNFCD